MLDSISSIEVERIRRVIVFVLDALDSDYQTRIGVERSEVLRVMPEWSDIESMGTQSDFSLLVHNSLNDALNGIDITNQECVEKIGCNRDELNELFEKWRHFES